MFLVWPENWLTINLLPLIQWQYIVGDKVMKVGPDQTSLWQLIDRHPDAPGDKNGAFSLFEDLMVASQVYCEIWNKK